MKNKTAFKTIIVALCMLVCSLALFSGCGYKGYGGEYVDLYTVAINSVLWNTGHSYGADFARDSEIEVLETDGFGRTLFTYYESYYLGSELSFSSLIISQGSVDGYAYYYEDKNYLVKVQERFSRPLKDFTHEEIENLKSTNDWGKEINSDKCIKKQIINKKPPIPCGEEIIEEKVVERFNLEDYYLKLDYLTSDDNDNFIAYGTVRISREYIFFAAIVKTEEDAVSEVQFFIPTDLYNYQQEFVAFKQNNGWISEK